MSVMKTVHIALHISSDIRQGGSNTNSGIKSVIFSQKVNVESDCPPF